MVFFPDKRSRYAGRGQWDVPPGSARGDNPVQNPEPKTDLAARAPIGAFRVSTTTDPALLQSQAESEALKAKQDAEAQRRNDSSDAGSTYDLYDERNNLSDSSEYHSTPIVGSTLAPSSIDELMGSETSVKSSLTGSDLISL